MDLTVRPTIADSLVSECPLVSKDHRYVLCCCGCDIRVYSVQSGQIVHILKGHEDAVTHIAFNPANQFQVISCSLDGTLKKWNFEDGVLVNEVKPACDDKAKASIAVVHRIYSMPNDKTHYLYLLKISGDSSEQQAVYKLIKQSVMMERWYSTDVICKFKDMPTHLSVGGQGSFLAALTSSNEFKVTSLSRAGKSYKHKVSVDSMQMEVQQCLAKLTCLTAHPTEDCVAVGHADGKINIWTNVMSKKAIYTWVHWHSLSVLSLTFSSEGSSLLSGGHESVLVKWPHGSYGSNERREYLPRLGAPISHITSSDDNSLTITAHIDNSIKVIKSWMVVQVYQGLTRDCLSAGDDSYPAGVTFEPVMGSLVVNGLPGHIQFYSLKQAKLLFNLDVVGQNYVSGDSLEKQNSYTRVEHIKFSQTGTWMVTVERWAGGYSQQCRMKFWYFDSDSGSYTLNTDVDTPHQGQVTQVQFAPHSDGPPMLVSVGGKDNKFKLWTLDVSSAAEGCWQVESTGYYKNKPCTMADFSDDGSVLAVVFDNVLTLWDPAENQLCTALDQGAKVTAVRFCHGTEANHLVVATGSHITIWDLLDFSEKQRWAVRDCTVLVADPAGSNIIAFSNHKGYVFNCAGDMEEFSLPGYAQHITSAAFTFQPAEGCKGLSSIKQRVYLSTKKGSILVVDDKDMSQHADITPTAEQARKTHIATNYQQSTPLSNLLNSQLVKSDQPSKQIDSRTGLAAAQFIKQIGETSCVAMPAVTTLCRAFLTSLLLDKNVSQLRDDRGIPDDEMEVDESSDKEDSDMEERVKMDDSSTTPTTDQQEIKRKLRKSDLLDFSSKQKT